MSIDIMSAVWGSGPTNSTDRFVLLNLADRADERGHCYPSYADIAKRCAMSRPTVINSMNRLQADGWIRTEVAYKKDGSRTSNRIFISMEKLGLQPDGSKESLPRSKGTLLGVVKNLDGGSKDSLPKSSINHQSETSDDYAPPPEPFQPPTPIEAIREHFVRQTALQPNDRTGSYERDWSKPLEKLLQLAHGDPAAGCILIDRALTVARGDNDGRKVYTVTCPRSLLSFATNLAAAQQTAVSTADDDTLWQRAIQAITRREYSDERLKAAIRAIGGTGRIASANGHDTPTLKRQLAAAYRQALAPTG